nr:MAG TPA: hypothetical protein [Crassvirales sp.]
MIYVYVIDKRVFVSLRILCSLSLVCPNHICLNYI